MSAELAILLARAMLWLENVNAFIFGVRGSVAVRRLANPVTFCDGREPFFVAASGQIRMAANRPAGSLA